MRKQRSQYFWLLKMTTKSIPVIFNFPWALRKCLKGTTDADLNTCWLSTMCNRSSYWNKNPLLTAEFHWPLSQYCLALSKERSSDPSSDLPQTTIFWLSPPAPKTTGVILLFFIFDYSTRTRHPQGKRQPQGCDASTLSTSCKGDAGQQ